MVQQPRLSVVHLNTWHQRLVYIISLVVWCVLAGFRMLSSCRDETLEESGCMECLGTHQGGEGRVRV